MTEGAENVRMRNLVLAPLLVLATTALAQDAPPSESPVEPPSTPLGMALLEVRGALPGQRATAVEKVLALGPSAADVARVIREGVARPPTPKGWHVLTATDEGGVARPYHLYIPEIVPEPDEPAPLLIDMHGGVARPVFIADEQFVLYRDTWKELADEFGIVVAMPLGRADCMWWSDAGVGHVRAVIRDVKHRADVDPDRIVATGFSDGGSGCYYLAMAAPDPFAAVMPMNGHPMVAVSASKRQLYLRNASQLPLFVCMTQDDGLYPAQTVLPHIQALIRNEAAVHLVSYPTGGHTPSYFEDQAEAFATFIMGARRDPLPDRIEWATAHVETGAAQWAEITAIGVGEDDAAADAVPDIQVLSTPGRVLIGIGVDREYTGVGVRVTSVDARRPAGDLGLQVGDVLTRVDDTPIKNLGDLRKALGKKRFGDELRVDILRDGSGDGEPVEPILASTVIPPFVAEPSYARDRETAWFSLARDGNTVNVTSRGVRGLRLHLSDAQFDFEKEVVVIVNGVERARAKPVADVRRIVESWAKEADPGRLLSATLDVSIPAADADK